MNRSKFARTGVAVATAGVLIATTPAAIGQADAPMPDATSVTADLALLSHSNSNSWKNGGNGNIGFFGSGAFDDDDDDDDDDDGSYGAYGDDDDDDDNDDDDGWNRGGFGSFVTDFLANNQAEVIAVTAMIPVFNLGPVAVGNSLLANAYYSGYNGSAVGVDGVVSYVTSQIGVPPADLVQGLVLGATARVPRFNVGPVTVGNSLLANAYFSGYDGSATGIPGLVSYVTSQLGIQATPAPVGAVKAAAVKASAVAAVSTRSVASVRAAGGTAPEVEAGDDGGAADSAKESAQAAPKVKADGPRTGRSAAGRAVAKVAGAAGQARASATRSAGTSGSDAG